MLQTTFQAFFVVAEKPKIGLILTIASGVTNMILDYLFICVFGFGMFGAALATVIGYMVGGIIPFIYFLRPNSSLLRLTRTKLYPKVLALSCINGSSEMVSNLSMSITTFLYNWQMMRLVGEDGVAAVGIIFYIYFIFISIFLGFSIGTAPIIGYNYGAENHGELKNMLKKCLVIISVVSVSMVILAEIMSTFAVSIFINEDSLLREMTLRGFRINSLSFFVCGFNIFGSAFFTALCNGKISAVISFLRSLVFQSGMLIGLPFVFELDGVWFALVIAETITLFITGAFIIGQRKKYNYA